MKALAKGVRVVGGAVASPFRLASRANKEHKAKKASKAQALAALRFSRMAPRYQKDVIRTRRRLFDDL